MTTNFKLYSNAFGWNYYSVFGIFRIGKGMKHCWTLNITDPATLIGIIDEERLFDNEYKNGINDFTNGFNKGYVASTSHDMFRVYHAGYDPDGDLSTYANQFIKNEDKSIIVSVELDMSQTLSQGGILKYYILNEKKKDIPEIQTDGKYTNIAYDDVDINRKYRLSVGLYQDTTEDCKWHRLIA